jgi:hypothetical protein
VAEKAAAQSGNPAVRRVVRDVIGTDVADALGEGLASSDLTSLMLEVMQRRASGRSPGDIIRQYERDRFTRPAAVDARELLSTIAVAVDAIGSHFELVETSPLVPLGTHSVVAGISQNRVVSTIRSTEVASDPTNSLALDAAVRRRAMLRVDPRSSEIVRLAAIDRVVRAQQFSAPRSFAHFTLLGLVTAGRDVGHRHFEQQALQDHLSQLVAVCQATGFPRLTIQLTDLTGNHDAIVTTVSAEMSNDHVSVTPWPERTAGRNYYQSLCFKLGVVDEGETIEIADGGLVDWTQSLLDNRKERLMISGLSVERLTLLCAPQSR